MNESPTYQELFAANRQLVAENELLRKENAKLSSLVKSIAEVGEDSKNVELTSGNKAPKPIFQEKKIVAFLCLSLEEKVSLFSSLFKGREDLFAKRWYSKASGKSGYQLVCLNEWNRQLCNKKKYRHVWILFEEPLAAIKARKLGNAILTEAMVGNAVCASGWTFGKGA